MPRRARGKYCLRWLPTSWCPIGSQPTLLTACARPAPPPQHIYHPTNHYVLQDWQRAQAHGTIMLCVYYYLRPRSIYTRKVFFLGQYHAGSAVNPLMSPILCPSLFSKMQSILQLLRRNAITCTKTEGDAAITNTPRNHSKVWQLSTRSRSIFKRSGFFCALPQLYFV